MINRDDPSANMCSDGVKTNFLLALILLAALLIVFPFIKGLAWAVILVVSTWPVFGWVRRRLKSDSLSSLVMCLLVVSVVLLAIVPMTVRLSQEAQDWVGNQSPEALQSRFVQFSETLKKVPLAGESAYKWIMKMRTSSDGMQGLVATHEDKIMTTISSAARGLMGAVTTLSSMLIFAFFLYRDGESMGQRTCQALSTIFGRYGVQCCTTVVSTIRGTVLGVVVTAFAQALLATAAYYVVGAPFPALLGFATLVLAFVPFGAPLVYVPLSAYLVLQGQGWGWGVALLAWGIGVVSSSDNFLRPLFISRATKISMLYVLLGVLGGLISMGMLGVFVGPVIIALAVDIVPLVLIDRDKQAACAVPKG